MSGEQGVMGQLQKSLRTLSEVSAYWMSAAESLPVPISISEDPIIFPWTASSSCKPLLTHHD